MKLGSMVMILRPGFSVLTGNHPVLLVQKKPVNQDPTSRWWWLFFDLDGIVWVEFVPRNTTVNYEYYKGLLEHLRNDVHKKQPEKWANSFILDHDNALCHTSLLVWQFLSNKNITVCPHPPYSLDLAPCDFWLFPKFKMTMKGKSFESIQDVEAVTTVQLKTLTKEDFQNCFRMWQEWWDKCVRSKRGVFWGGLLTMCFLL